MVVAGPDSGFYSNMPVKGKNSFDKNNGTIKIYKEQKEQPKQGGLRFQLNDLNKNDTLLLIKPGTANELIMK